MYWPSGVNAIDQMPAYVPEIVRTMAPVDVCQSLIVSSSKLAVASSAPSGDNATLWTVTWPGPNHGMGGAPWAEIGAASVADAQAPSAAARQIRTSMGVLLLCRAIVRRSRERARERRSFARPYGFSLRRGARGARTPERDP